MRAERSIMKELLEQGGGLALTGVIFGIGMLARLVLWAYYSLLGSACKNLETTKNKAICDIRQELRQRVQNGVGIKSVSTYMECRLSKCKAAGVRVGVWEGITEQSVLLVMLVGTLSALGGVLWECENKLILAMLFLGEMSAVLLLAADLFIGVKEKHERTRLCIRDYIENCCLLDWDKPYIVSDLSYEGISAKSEKRRRITRREKKELHRKAREAKKAEAVRIRQEQKEKKRIEKALGARRQKRCKAEMEKRRLTEELLKERRQLEAKQFAEQKSREREEETVETQKTETVAQERKEIMETAAQEREEIRENVAQEIKKAAETSVQEKEEAKEVQEQPKESAMEQAQAEAAAASADHSYEAMLREVLAEYLA